MRVCSLTSEYKPFIFTKIAKYTNAIVLTWMLFWFIFIVLFKFYSFSNFYWISHIPFLFQWLLVSLIFKEVVMIYVHYIFLNEILYMWCLYVQEIITRIKIASIFITLKSFLMPQVSPSIQIFSTLFHSQICFQPL